MTITLGRVGTDGISVGAPLTVGFQGGRVTLSGRQSSTSAAEVLWLRDQLVGLAGNDSEPVVPFTCSERPELDGFYRVASASATHEVGGLGGAVSWLPWEVQLERVVNWRQPRMEVRGVWGLLTNSYGYSGDPVRSFPGGAIDVYSTVAGYFTRPTSDGAGVLVSKQTSTTSTGSFTDLFSVAAAGYYGGGCHAEYDVTGSGAWRRATGRLAFTAADVAAMRVRLNNGLVRVTPTSTVLNLEWWDGTQWDPATSFTLSELATPSGVSFTSCQVLRLSSEEVVLRLQGTVASLAPIPATTDVTVRRGLRTVSFRTTTPNNVLRFQIAFTTATACTAELGSADLRRSVNNAGGNREVIVTNTNATVTAASGKIAQTAATGEFLFGIGNEVGGTAAAGSTSDATDQIREWFGAVSETQRVVAA